MSQQQDRLQSSQLPLTLFLTMLLVSLECVCYEQGFAVPSDNLSAQVPFSFEGQEYVLEHGSVVIAAITSCTNTSNPSVMLGAGEFPIVNTDVDLT